MSTCMTIGQRRQLWRIGTYGFSFLQTWFRSCGTNSLTYLFKKSAIRCFQYVHVKFIKILILMLPKSAFLVGIVLRVFLNVRIGFVPAAKKGDRSFCAICSVRRDWERNSSRVHMFLFRCFCPFYTARDVEHYILFWTFPQQKQMRMFSGNVEIAAGALCQAGLHRLFFQLYYPILISCFRCANIS